MAPLLSEVSKKAELSISYWKEAKTMVEVGHPEGWGRVLEVPAKKDQYGLGYQSPQVTQRTQKHPRDNFFHYQRLSPVWNTSKRVRFLLWMMKTTTLM